MRKTLLIVVIMALVIGLCATVASAKPDNGQAHGQGKGLLKAPGLQFKLQQADTGEFTDVQNHWAKWAINKAQARGIFEGYGDGTFGPENVMTKAQTLVLLGKLTAEDSDSDDDADDEDDDADEDDEGDNVPGWARKSVRKAVYHGYIKRFHSEVQCQRAYAFALIARQLEDKLPQLPDGYVNPFADLEGWDPFAGIEEETGLSGAEIYEYMMRLHLAGIVKGSDGNLNPNGGIKRAEMAILLDQIEQFKNKKKSDIDSSTDADDVERKLEDGSYAVGDIAFRLKLTYDEDDKTVKAKFYAKGSGAAAEWEDLSNSTIEDDVIDICKVIAAAFEDDADVTLVTIYISFHDEDDGLLADFEYDVSSGDLD